MSCGNPAHKWMETSVGVSFHWTSCSVEQDGTKGTYREMIERFDVPRFVEKLKNAGADHLILTLTHAEQYLALPCTPLEELLPGRTTQRDLIGELTDALGEAGIRFIAYYNHSCNGLDDVVWKDACGYSAGIGGDLDKFADNICSIVEFIARRYGRKLAGWWFDSCYSLDGQGHSHAITCDMGDWLFPWTKYIRAAKAGYADCAVTLNAGVGHRYLYWPEQDYYAGESVELDQEFPPYPDNGMVDHRWICIDNPQWVYHADGSGEFCDPRFTDEEVAAFVRANLAARRMTTFNMEIDRSGNINEKALRQFEKVRNSL